MQNLNIRYPNLYTTNQYCKCSSIEDTLHILLCSKNTKNIQQSLTNIINNTLQQSQLISISDITLLNTLSLLSTNSTNIQYNFLIPTILGIYSKPTYHNTKILLKKQTELFLTNFSNNLLNWFYHIIWSQRNIFQHQWEIARNITKKTKRTKITLPSSTTQANTSRTHIQPINLHSAIEK